MLRHLLYIGPAGDISQRLFATAKQWDAHVFGSEPRLVARDQIEAMSETVLEKNRVEDQFLIVTSPELGLSDVGRVMNAFGTRLCRPWGKDRLVVFANGSTLNQIIDMAECQLVDGTLLLVIDRDDAEAAGPGDIAKAILRPWEDRFRPAGGVLSYFGIVE